MTDISDNICYNNSERVGDVLAYKVLYRKYRPKTFDEVVGQDHIVKTLKNAIVESKIAHAYLFCGPRGTGKTTVAKIFAKAINCEDKNHAPCMHCDHCKESEDGTHPDIIEIDAASNNGVEEARNLIEKVKYAPLQGKYKIYIIDEVHMMSTGAFNALLKTIEEPPAHVIFILATTEPHKVISTIISRCQRFDFLKISDEGMKNVLADVLRKEQVVYEEEALNLIIQLADGGMRDALSILDQCISYANDKLTVEDIRKVYGVLSTENKLQLLENIAQSQTETVLANVQMWWEKGIDIKRLTIDLIDIMKESIIYEYTNSFELLHILNQEQVISCLKVGNSSQRLQLIDLLMNTFEKYRNALNMYSYFELCFLKMIDVFHTEKIENVSRETMPVIETNQEQLQTSLTDEKIEKENLPQEDCMEELTQSVECSQDEDHSNDKTPYFDINTFVALLVGASKEEKQTDMDKLSNIKNYVHDLVYAKYANMMQSCQLIASGTNYLMIEVKTKIEANEINEQENIEAYAHFMKQVLGKVKRVIALTAEDKYEAIQSFMDRRNANTLPNPIVLEDIQIKEKNQATEEDILIDLLGDHNLRIEED